MEAVYVVICINNMPVGCIIFSAEVKAELHEVEEAEYEECSLH